MSERRKVTWEKGGEAELQVFSGERLEVLSTAPYAPGAPLKGKLIGGNDALLELKVHGCKKAPDGRFAIHGRVVNLTRELRALLQSLLDGGAQG